MKPYLNLRAEITRKGMSLKELAQYIGVSPTHLSEKLNKKYEFKQSEIDKVLKLTNGTYEEIFLDI